VTVLEHLLDILVIELIALKQVTVDSLYTYTYTCFIFKLVEIRIIVFGEQYDRLMRGVQT